MSHPTRGPRGRHRRRHWDTCRHATWSMRPPRPPRRVWPYRFVGLSLAVAQALNVCCCSVGRAVRRLVAVLGGRGRSRGPGTPRLADLLAVIAAASLAGAGPLALSVLSLRTREITMTGHRSRSTSPPDAFPQHCHGPRAATGGTGTSGRGAAAGRPGRAARAEGSSAAPRPGEDESPSVLPLYTPAAAAQQLAVRESWLRRRAAARAVPCTFLGRHLRFSRADLEAIARAAAHPPLTAPQAVPGGVSTPAPDAVDVDDELPEIEPAGRSSRSRPVQPAARRRGPNKASRHRQAAAAEVEDGRERAA